MQDNDLESKQNARFIVHACKQDKSIKPQIIKPILQFDENSEFTIGDFVYADLGMLQQNLSITDIIALNWFVRISDSKTCHFEDFLKELSVQSKKSISEVKEWIINQSKSSSMINYSDLTTVWHKSPDSVYVAKQIVQYCLNDSNVKTVAITPYFELDSNANLVLQGFTEANHYHYHKNISKYEIYALNWFITADNHNICYFEDFIIQAKLNNFRFSLANFKL